jgi:hypothetical protein
VTAVDTGGADAFRASERRSHRRWRCPPIRNSICMIDAYLSATSASRRAAKLTRIQMSVPLRMSAPHRRDRRVRRPTRPAHRGRSGRSTEELCDPVQPALRDAPSVWRSRA